MIAWTAARMDPGVYGERIAFHFPNDTSTDGPALVESRIDQDDAISAQFSLWDRSGSSVIRGNLLVLPLGEDGLLYVEPIFLQASGAPFPQFVRVIMVSNERVAFAENVPDAIEQVLGAARRRRPTAAEGSRRTWPAWWRRRSGSTRGAGRAGRRRPGHLPGSAERARAGARTAGGADRRVAGAVTQRLAVARGDPGPRLRGARARPRLAAGPGRRSAPGADRARQRGHSRGGRAVRPRPARPGGGGAPRAPSATTWS